MDAPASISKTPFEYIPPETNIKIFELVPGVTLAKLQSVCKNWQNFLTDETLWKQKFVSENDTYIPQDFVSWKEAYKKQFILIRNLIQDRCVYKKIRLPGIYHDDIRIVSVKIFEIGNKIIISYNSSLVSHPFEKTHGEIDCYNKQTEEFEPFKGFPSGKNFPNPQEQFYLASMKFVKTLPLENERLCSISDQSFTIWDANTRDPIFARNNFQHIYPVNDSNQENIIIKNNIVIYCNISNQVEIWDLTAKECIHLIEMNTSSNCVKSLFVNEELAAITYDYAIDLTGVSVHYFNSPTPTNLKEFTPLMIKWGQANLKTVVGSVAITEKESNEMLCTVSLFNLQTGMCIHAKVLHSKRQWTHDSEFLYYVDYKNRKTISKVDIKTGAVTPLCSSHEPIFEIITEQNRLIAYAGTNPGSMHIWTKTGDQIVHCKELLPRWKTYSYIDISKESFINTSIKDNILYLGYCGGHVGDNRVQFWNLANGKCLLEKQIHNNGGTSIVNGIVYSFPYSAEQAILYDYQTFVPKPNQSYMQQVAALASSVKNWFIKK